MSYSIRGHGGNTSWPTEGKGPGKQLPSHFGSRQPADDLDGHAPAVRLRSNAFNHTGRHLVHLVGSYLPEADVWVMGTLNRHARAAMRKELDDLRKEELAELCGKIRERLSRPNQQDCLDGYGEVLALIGGLPLRGRVGPLRVLAESVRHLPWDADAAAAAGAQVLELAQEMPEEERAAVLDALAG